MQDQREGNLARGAGKGAQDPTLSQTKRRGRGRPVQPAAAPTEARTRARRTRATIASLQIRIHGIAAGKQSPQDQE